MIQANQYFYDTEFIETGAYRPLHLISLGMRNGKGEELYLQNRDCPFELAGPWLVENVFPRLVDFNVEARVPMDRPRVTSTWVNFNEIASILKRFVYHAEPKLYGYYSAYDMVLLAQCFGTLRDLPTGWPKYTRDIKQIADAVGNPRLPAIERCFFCEECRGSFYLEGVVDRHCGEANSIRYLTAHNALDDARWNSICMNFLERHYLSAVSNLDVFGDLR